MVMQEKDTLASAKVQIPPVPFMKQLSALNREDRMDFRAEEKSDGVRVLDY